MTKRDLPRIGSRPARSVGLILSLATGCADGSPGFQEEDGVAALQAQVADLEARVLALEAAGGSEACPEGMVAVGDFCIDVYKASVRERADCTGKEYGVAWDSFPFEFPDSGDWTAPLYACSLPGVVPAGDVSWFQAAQACALSGKSLCTNDEWQVAAAGYPADSALCNLDSLATSRTGEYPACFGSWGTFDQVGIRWEWTADWTVGGASWMIPELGDRGFQTPWPPEFGDGDDYTLNVDGEAMYEGGEMVKGLPAVVTRGGDYANGSSGGHFSMSTTRGPSHATPYIGFRCCAPRGG